VRGRVKVLFVCYANAIRSQMAEAFARAYGSDVIQPMSAGMFAGWAVAPIARQVMQERGIALDDHFPKGVDEIDLNAFDLIVNMSGLDLPGGATAAAVREWDVSDPVAGQEKEYRAAADEIERRVMQLILELRSPAGR
jgi:arsenate reductase